MPNKSIAQRRIAAAAVGALASAALTVGVASLASAAPSSSPMTATDPVVSYFQQHHGVMPTVQEQAHIAAWQAAHPDAVRATGGQLSYNGGINGQGVMSGAKTKVYLVFYGNQWGTESTDANGNAKFTGDPSSVASVTQQMFKGIGTNGELWSADLTQWCDGSTVSSGATSCPSNTPAANFVPYQSGGVLAGVWYDNGAAEPNAPNGHALAQEAINAAGHFGNTTAASNRNTYYVIMSAHGTNPDNYQGQYCAWHDYNDDAANLSGGANPSSFGNDIAFSNQPYNTDSGQGCGVGFVNGSSGTTDGYTMTLGHEWHEMMSDTYPNTAWNGPGGENSDECAWIQPGQAGGAANVSFGSFGSYAEQASWSNDTNGCAISHQILTHGGGQGNTVTVTNPGNQTGTVGTAASLQIKASDSASGQTLTYSASGLPAGLSINSSSGLISGSPTAAGTSNATVTVKDATGATGSTSFTWTVSAPGGGGTVTVTNPGQQIWITGYAFYGLQIKASDSKNLALTFSATGLPPGMTISSSGDITGTPTVAGSYTVKVNATDTGGSTGSTTFTFTIYA